LGAWRRIALVASVGLGLWFGVGALGSSPALAAACDPTTNPASDYSWTGLQWDTDQEIDSNFTAARAAEGCQTPMVLPAAYDSMSPQLQMLWLFNSEREARGEPDLQLDRTLMSQVALNHSLEMATYGYFDHPSPINQLGVGQPGVDVPRELVNPVFATNDTFGENLAGTFASPAEAVFAYMYVDSSQGWGHRGAILQAGYQWTGIGIYNGPNGPLYTDDFEAYIGFGTAPVYTPPATADTNPPAIASVSYANGTATATGVADSPLNVNDTGANPTTAAITGVVFYVNNIVEDANQNFNTVSGTQTAPGTWTAPITVNPGDVLHAVAVDGSGNFTDITAPPPAATLTAGANTVALPAAGTATTTAMSTLARSTSSASTPELAATPTAKALIASVDRQAGRKIAESVRVYVNGHWQTYRPGGSSNFALYANEGVQLTLSTGTKWRPTTRRQRFGMAGAIHLRKGWNYVAVPYPTTGMTCHATRLELARLGDKLLQITVGPTPNRGVIMKPNKKGQWGNDLLAKLPYSEGFWLKVTTSSTWTPSPEGYDLPSQAIK
jgi:uncharacterized protein YkwD